MKLPSEPQASNNAIRLAVFDLAGTTVFDGDAVGNSLRQALRQGAGLEISRDEANTIMGTPKDQAIARILTAHGRNSTATDAHVLELLAQFERIMLEHYRHAPDVVELDSASVVFETLLGRGIFVGIDTGFSTPITEAVLERMGWLKTGLVSAWTCSDKVKAGRPAPYMVYQLMERLGVIDVATVAKVGDTPSDLNMGKNARVGLNVGVLNGSHTRAQLEVHPHDVLLAGISQLPEFIQHRHEARAI